MPRNLFINPEYVRRERESAWEPTAPAGLPYGWPYYAPYAARPGYYRRRAELPPERLERYRWEWPHWRRSRESEERWRRALADRDLAHAVDLALYEVIGRVADDVSVRAQDGVVTLEGVVPHPGVLRDTVETALRMPGVRYVEDRLRVRMPR
ncbi:MAG TPA: BON domain-containing protein [Longimicrobiales bacterium]|nr:BON domain-containing protein [Longimicrobiales bacterium]